MTLTRSELAKMKETDLHIRLKRLFEKMGYQDVRITHGPSEAGKDLVMWRLDEAGRRLNVAVVAKPGVVNGSAETGKRTAGGVYYQIKSCFNAPFVDSLALQTRQVDRVIVIASHRYTEEARISLERCADSEWRDQVTLWDGDELFNQLKRHLGPAALHENLRSVLADASAFDEHYELLPVGPGLKGKAQVGYVDKDQIRLVLAEKCPEASQAAPFTVKITGRVHRDVAQRLLNPGLAGGFVTIPGEGIEIEYPPILQSMFQEHRLEEIRIGRVSAGNPPHEPPKELCLRLEVLKDSELLATWGSMTLRSNNLDAGGLAWSNQHEGSGLLLHGEIHPGRPADSRFNLGMDVPPSGIKVEQLDRAIEFLEALSSGDTLVIHNITEGRLAEEDLTRCSFAPLERSGCVLVRCLLAIQRRYGCEFVLTSLTLRSEEHDQILELGQLILDGEVGFHNLAIVGTAETRDTLSSQIAGNPGALLSGRRTYNFLGFETTESLGYHFKEPRLHCEDLGEGQFRLAISGTSQVLRFHDTPQNECETEGHATPSALSSSQELEPTTEEGNHQ